MNPFLPVTTVTSILKEKKKSVQPSIVNQILSDALEQERARQKSSINLIASENYVSDNVLNAIGNVFTNKYAEGYPTKRYYQGCENVDVVEQYAIEKLKTLFGAEAANVQPHSGSQANQAVYLALLQPNDTVLAMSLSSGGHLSHGLSANFSGKLYNFVHYEVDRHTYKINYDEILRLALKHRPKLIIAGASSYSQEIDFSKFRKICDRVNSLLMVDMAHIAGLVAANLHQSPIPFADIVTSTTHKTLRGPRGGFILCREKYIKKINKAVFPGIQGGPLENIIFSKAIAFDECSTELFRKYSGQTIFNAQSMCHEFIKNNIQIISGVTQNHQFSIDVKKYFSITGKEAAEILAKNFIYVNQNVIPFDTEKPFLASGIRLGCPAITSLGANEKDCRQIALLIIKILKSPNIKEQNEKWQMEAKQLISQIQNHAKK